MEKKDFWLEFNHFKTLRSQKCKSLEMVEFKPSVCLEMVEFKLNILVFCLSEPGLGQDVNKIKKGDQQGL